MRELQALPSHKERAFHAPSDIYPSAGIYPVGPKQEAQTWPAVHAISHSSHPALPINALPSTHYIFTHGFIFRYSDESSCHSLRCEPVPRTHHLEDRRSKRIFTRPSRHMQDTVCYLLNPKRWGSLLIIQCYIVAFCLQELLLIFRSVPDR